MVMPSVDRGELDTRKPTRIGLSRTATASDDLVLLVLIIIFVMVDGASA